jgi:ribosomal-protein-alanine N-acetyltransferase
MFPVMMTGRRITLREMSEDDAADLHAYATHPLVMARALDDPPSEVETIRELIKAWLSRDPGHQRTHYQLGAVMNGRLIGSAMLTVVSAEHQRGEIGYVVHPDWWGRGIATEAAELLLELGFQTLGLHRIEATTRPDNTASWRVLEKIGMQREGLIRDHMLLRGTWVDSLTYAILATDPRPGSPGGGRGREGGRLGGAAVA